MIRSIVKCAILSTSIMVLTASTQPVVGQAAPPFQLTLIDGSKITSDDLKGQVVILNYWATWCVPCRKELPLLDAYYQAQRSHGLRVFAVTTEDSLPTYRLKKLFAAMHITPIRKIKGPYNSVNAVPTNYIIGRTGRIRYAKSGAFDLADLNATIVPLLQESAPAN